jgi:uncharacterized membrane protein
MIGAVHVSLGVMSLLFGAWIFLAAKGTRTHVRLGWVYVACIAGLNASALGIYHLTGRPNLFHGLAVASLAMTGIGIAQPLRRRQSRKWLWRHYQYMCWSYVGLLAATVNEAAVRLPVLRQFCASTLPALPLLASGAMVGVGAGVILFFQRRVLESTGHSGRE